VEIWGQLNLTPDFVSAVRGREEGMAIHEDELKLLLKALAFAADIRGQCKKLLLIATKTGARVGEEFQLMYLVAV
jgi:hypothetical protein